MDFSRPPASIEEIFRLIAKAPTGRRVLECFFPLYKKRTVRVETYPPEVLARLREAVGEGVPIGAAFIPDEDEGTIYLDLASPLGVLAPFLLHEMVHALDPSLWDAARGTLSEEEKNDVLLETETEAFETQHLFIQELKNRDKAYGAFLKSHFPKAVMLHERLTGDDVSRIYGLKKRRKPA